MENHTPKNRTIISLRSSFAAKLSLWMLALVLGVLTGSLVLLKNLSIRLVENKVSQDFERVAKLSEEALSDRIDVLNLALESALSDATFRGHLSRARSNNDDFGLGESNDEGLKNTNKIFFSATLPLFRNYENLVILNADSKLIFTKSYPDLLGVDWSQSRFLNELKNRDTVVSAVSQNSEDLIDLGLLSKVGTSQPLLLIAKNISVGSNSLGSIVVAERLSQNVIPKMESLINGEVFFEVFGRYFVSKEGEALGSDLLKTIEGTKGMLNVDLNSRAHFIKLTDIAHPKSNHVFARAVIKKEVGPELLLIQKNMWIALLKTLLVSVVLAIVLALIISGKVSESLKTLISGVEKVKSGDLNVTLKVTSQDEFGSLTSAFNDMTLGLRQRELIKQSFQKYVGKSVLANIIETDSLPQLSGAKKNLSLMFSDIKGFTEYVEAQPAIKVISELNQYLSLATSVVNFTEGTVDKFVGDAVMAHWDNEALTNGASNSCRAALGFQRAVDEMKEMNVQFPKWQTRIGIATGECLVGNVGSEDKLQFTAMGDVVNTAARLESLNKHLDTKILVDGETLSRLANQGFLLRNLGLVKLKGKKQTVNVFELVAFESEASNEKREFVAQFNEGVKNLNSGQYEKAKFYFSSCFKIDSKDRALESYLKKTSELSTRVFNGEPVTFDFDS